MNVVIIGAAGHWHIVRSAAEADERVKVIAIAPGCPGEDITNLKNAFPDAKVCAEWHEALETPGAEYAAVNPPFSYAADITVAALEKGLHVYSEKPLAIALSDLERIEKVLDASGKAIGGMFNYRYFPWFLAMEQAVNNGDIGTLRQIHAQKSYRMGIRPEFYKKRETFGGLIPWVAIHAIQWATAFGGSCDWVSASHSAIENRGNGDMECTSAVLMGMENGVIATVTADFFRPTGSARHDDDRLRLTGTRGMVEVIDGIVYLENEEHKRTVQLPPMKNAFIEFAESISTDREAAFRREAIYNTLIALRARDSADAAGPRMEI